jgi:predicted Zn-dependent peptidase
VTKKYQGMIPDYNLEVDADNEKEAIHLMLQRLREMFATLSDEELEREMGIIVWCNE